MTTENRPTPLEVASGLVFGFTPPDPLPAPQITLSARQALEQAILPALLRPPCLMSFSGGRASSAVLAVAVLLARREGLELPVPATNRLDGVAGRNERAMQERVIVHLGLTEWARLASSATCCPASSLRRGLLRHTRPTSRAAILAASGERAGE
jgi:hypothetical protein